MMDVLAISINGLEGGLLVISPALVLLMILAADGLPNPVDLAVGIPPTVDGVFANGFDFRLRNNSDKFSSNGSPPPTPGFDESEGEEPSAAAAVRSADLELESSDFGSDDGGGTWLKNDPLISSFIFSLASSFLEDDDKDTSSL